MGPTTIGHFLFMISYLKISPTLIFSSILLCREEKKKKERHLWNSLDPHDHIHHLSVSVSKMAPSLSDFKQQEISYFSQFKELAGLLSPALLMSHMQLGWKVQDGYTVMSHNWCKSLTRVH